MKKSIVGNKKKRKKFAEAARYVITNLAATSRVRSCCLEAAAAGLGGGVTFFIPSPLPPSSRLIMYFLPISLYMESPFLSSVPFCSFHSLVGWLLLLQHGTTKRKLDPVPSQTLSLVPTTTFAAVAANPIPT
jgi:hypothetical protein